LVKIVLACLFPLRSFGTRYPHLGFWVWIFDLFSSFFCVSFGNLVENDAVVVGSLKSFPVPLFQESGLFTFSRIPLFSRPALNVPVFEVFDYSVSQVSVSTGGIVLPCKVRPWTTTFAKYDPVGLSYNFSIFQFRFVFHFPPHGPAPPGCDC